MTANFAILRVQKLKAGVAVHRSLKHAFRAQETPNADPERTPDNAHIGAASVDEAMAKFADRLPDKHRKDAVQCVEYLVAASPEAMASKSREQQDAYLQDALNWIRERHGAENVVYAGIHRDETTPHLYAYVVPLDPDSGRLNAKRWFGGAKALSEMQTDFAQTVGQRHDLERGIEGSRAQHQRVREYYARVNEPTPSPQGIDVPEAKFIEGKDAYGRRVAESVLEQLRPQWDAMAAKATELDAVQKRERETTRTAERLRERLEPILEALRPLNDLMRENAMAVMKAVGEKFQKEQREQQLQRLPDRPRDRGPDLDR